MKGKLSIIAMASLIATPVAISVPTQASAEYHHYYGHGGHYRYRCRRSSGTTGAIAGGVGGAVIGNAIGGGVLGTVAGGVGGALLGKHLDKKHDAAQNRRNGC